MKPGVSALSGRRDHQSHRKGIESVPGAHSPPSAMSSRQCAQRAEGSGAQGFNDYRNMMDSGAVDAIMIASRIRRIRYRAGGV